jgi:anti-sigma regulatory factor (Ser/Thr protein kinase)
MGMDDEAEVVTTEALTEVDPQSSSSTSLPPHPSSIGAARRFVRGALLSGGRDELADDAELAVSEVVTNAVVHAGTRIEVNVVLGPVLVRVEVEDGSPHLPRARRYATTASTGRGLSLLNDTAADWGVTPTHRGKAVWFELAPSLSWRDDGVASDGDDLSGAARNRSGREGARIALLGAPVLLYDAWRQHAEALLREHLLATLDDGKPEDAVQVHAEASDALALLDEAMPVPPPTDSPADALTVALSPHASSARIDLLVPNSSRRHFITLDRTLEDALERAEAGTFLTPAVQPELRELRRWLCDQVTSQCLGAEPVPWAPRETMTPASIDAALSRLEGWDAGSITSSDRALIAVDDGGLIVAGSRAAHVLLANDDPGAILDLPGTRLVGLIPHRFREAHLAGFTMHLLTGNGMMLDTPVVVPVLCHDGTERSVQLTVHEEHVAVDGRPVFIAEFETVPTSVPK